MDLVDLVDGVDGTGAVARAMLEGEAVMPYEFLEHTADVRVACWARDLSGLLDEAAAAFYSVALHARETREEEIRAVSFDVLNLEELVVRWLSELLFLLDTEGFVALRTTWALPDTPGTVTATCAGYRGAPEMRAEEIKAVTYHGLAVRCTPAGYGAEIVFDL